MFQKGHTTYKDNIQVVLYYCLSRIPYQRHSSHWISDVMSLACVNHKPTFQLGLLEAQINNSSKTMKLIIEFRNNSCF